MATLALAAAAAGVMFVPLQVQGVASADSASPANAAYIATDDFDHDRFHHHHHRPWPFRGIYNHHRSWPYHSNHHHHGFWPHHRHGW